jgi:hypothetical protein
MLIGGILLGLVLGLLAGGRLRNLAEIQLRWTGLLVAALVLRFATEAALNAGIDIVETLRLPLLLAAFGVLLIPLWANRTYPGLILAFLGVLSNGLVILVNGGYMPIWEPALAYAGLTPCRRHAVIPRDRRGQRPGLRRSAPDPRRRHPDPHPVHPERLLAWRSLPWARSGVLPVRRRGPRPDSDRGAAGR